MDIIFNIHFFKNKKKYMIYEELKKRDLINNTKEYDEMVWLRQIKVNGNMLINPSYEPENIKTIQIGILEFEL